MPFPLISQIKQQARLLGVLQLTIGAGMISFSAIFVKLAHVGPTMAGFYRVLFGGIILSGIVCVKRERLFYGTRHALTILVSSIFFALVLTFWHRSVLYVGPGLATFLSNLQVFFLVGFGLVVLGERPTRKFWVSIALAVVGLFLLVGLRWAQISSDYKTGIIFGLISALCYSAYLITLRKSRHESKSRSGLGDIALISLLTSPIVGLEAWAQGESFCIPDLQSWEALLGYGLFSQAFGWLLISAAILKIAASEAGLILLLQPTLAFVWDVLLFERPTVTHEILGAILLLFAIYLGTASRGS